MFVVVNNQSPSVSDLDLARRCAAGDPDAQRRFFRDYRRLVHGILYRILGNNREIEDLVQDAFVESYRSLERFRGESSLATWIGRITTRVALAHIRRRKPEPVELDSVPMPSNAPTADREVLARQAAKQVYRTLSRLDAEQRVAFVLHVIDDRPLREVADLMGATLMATKSRVWRARRALLKRADSDRILAAYLNREDS